MSHHCQYQCNLPRLTPRSEQLLLDLCFSLLNEFSFYKSLIYSEIPIVQWCGVAEGLTVVAINGHYLTSKFGHAHLNLVTLLTSVDPSTPPPPLHLTVLSSTSETVKLCPIPSGGLGFHIRGSSPVVINGVDKGAYITWSHLYSVVPVVPVVLCCTCCTCCTLLYSVVPVVPVVLCCTLCITCGWIKSSSNCWHF